MSDITVDALAGEIRQRMDAINTEVSERTSDVALAELIRTNLAEYLASDEGKDVVRKLRFGGETEQARVAGTKYARQGLGVGDVEFLYDLQRGVAGQRKSSGGVYEGPSDELRRTFSAITAAKYVPADVLQRGDARELDEHFASAPVDWFHGDDRTLAAKGAWQLTEAYQRAVRAMDTAESGYGSQLVGAQYVGELWEAARRESRVFNLIDSFEMTAPTTYLPVEVDIPEVLFVSESTANNSSNYTTVKTGSQRVDVSAKKFVIHQMWSGEMEEDSLVPFVPFLRRQATLSVAHYSDSLVLNGDDTNAGTGNINLDDADPADTKHYLAFDGIRHAALVDNTANVRNVGGVGITLGDYNALRGLMVDTTNLVDWGHPTMADDLVYVSDISTADATCLLDEVVTVDKFGPQAAVLNGQVARLLGHPLIASLAVSKTEADGKLSTTGSNNTLGQVVAFNRRGFKVGWRRRVQVEVERIPATDQTRIVYSMRLGFGRFTPTGAASGIEAAAVARNISV